MPNARRPASQSKDLLSVSRAHGQSRGFHHEPRREYPAMFVRLHAGKGVLRLRGRSTTQSVHGAQDDNWKRSANCPRDTQGCSAVVGFSGRNNGNRITSRMVWESVNSMQRRSMPMPTPPAGGIP